jgi:hypothetical protein
MLSRPTASKANGQSKRNQQLTDATKYSLQSLLFLSPECMEWLWPNV